MTQIKRFFQLGLPIGLLLFCWVTMRTTASLGEESQTFYGFPFPWYSASMAASMAYDIALGALVLDLLTYLLASQLVISFWRLSLPSCGKLFFCWLHRLMAAGTGFGHFPADCPYL